MDAVLERQPDLYDADYWQQIYDMKPATLMVARTDESDVKQRQLVVYLDGERLGEIMFGESLRHEMLPGPHRIRISNTLVWKTIAFDLQIGEQVSFEAINRTGPGTLTMLVLLGAGPLYVTLQRM